MFHQTVPIPSLRCTRLQSHFFFHYEDNIYINNRHQLYNVFSQINKFLNVIFTFNFTLKKKRKCLVYTALTLFFASKRVNNDTTAFLVKRKGVGRGGDMPITKACTEGFGLITLIPMNNLISVTIFICLDYKFSRMHINQ